MMQAPVQAMSAALSACDPGKLFGLETAVPTTAAQREIFSASMLNPVASLAYNHAISIFLDGALDRGALYSALLNLIHRHEALRGRFSDDGLQFIVRERIAFEMPLIDLRHVSADQQQLAYDNIVRTELDHVFDLLEGPLFRAALILRQAGQSVLIFNCHHAVVDGWSLKIILDELPKLYSSLVPGGSTPALDPPASYLDYLKFSAAREREAAESVREYWRGVYADAVPVLDLPIDNPRPRIRDYGSLREDYRLDRELYAQLKSVGAKRGASQFVTLLATYAIYMHRLSGQRELVVGVPAAGQIASGKSSLLGHDARVMPIRCTLDEQDSFATYVKRVMGRFLSAYEHQWISMPELLREIDIEFEASRVPFVSIMFNFDPGMDQAQLAFADLKAKHFFNPRNADTFEQSVNAVVEGDELVLEWVYNRTLFASDEMHARLQQFEQLVRSIAEGPDVLLTKLQLVPAAQIAQMDLALNSTAMEFEHELCVDQLIERKVRANPQKVAVEFGAQRLTYQQLWDRSGQIAHAMLAASPGAKPLVGVMMERSADLVAALLGVWRAGGAFVPMDPDYPADRLEYMIEQSGMRVLLSQQALDPTRWGGRLSVIDVGAIGPEGAASSAPKVARHSGDLAYVIYTSGSTGRPKGVPIPHRALNNLLTTMAGRAPGIAPDERLLAVTTLSFDIAEAEVWMPLIAGATTVIADRATVMDGQALARTLRESRISMLQATPSTWRTLLYCGWPGDKQLTGICGGEALPPDLAADLFGRLSALWNAYGPTEATVWSTFSRVDAGPVTIGKPAGNYQVYVLDQHQAWVPRGCVGELWIGGESVAAGYLNREDLTRERFVPNPFTGRGLMYRTGDLVRMRRDGNIEFIGRNDFQVKVRGFRIELGEVQLALSRLPKIRQCVVVVHERSPGDTHLVAYYMVNEGHEPSAEELRLGLQATLPAYMVPTRFMQMDRFPQTDNGKINVKALPDPFGTKTNDADLSLRASEAVLARHPQLAAAALVWPQERGQRDIPPIGFIVPRGTEVPEEAALLEYLRGHCAEASIPEKFFVVASMPLTRQKQIDRDRLLEMHAAGAGTDAAQMLDAPRTREEKVLADLWREVLQLPRVGIRDNFFDIGGHSLLAVKLMVQLRAQLNIDVPPALLLEHPTIEKLAAALPSSGGEPVSLPGGMVQLKAGGSKNLFCVHDADGDVFLYRELAQQLSSFNVFGLIPHRRTNIPLLGVSVQEMAARYVQDVRAQQPRGPYYLAGLCAGGVLAFEMAAQLERLGESIGLVAIMDAIEPRVCPKKRLFSRKRLQGFLSAVAGSGSSLPHAATTSRDASRSHVAIGKILNSARYECGLLLTNMWVNVRFGILRIVSKSGRPWPAGIAPLTPRQIYLSALKIHQCKLLARGQVAVIKASEGADADEPMIYLIDDPTLGWGRFVIGKIELINVQGGHSTMLRAPFVEGLARQLTRLMRYAPITSGARGSTEAVSVRAGQTAEYRAA